MPLGVQRLNARQSAHPTPHVGFIKALPGPGAAVAEAFLSRVAAIVHPILAAHHLAVMTLEEYEPNREFLGRNFNAGEVIQLVLRRKSSSSSQTAASRRAVQTVRDTAARTGPGSESDPVWLPFRSVVLVMLHELAHCVQMNHRRAFWDVRNTYAEEMRRLWARGYTGEGMWGRGRTVTDAGLDGPVVGLEDDMPAHLCGGVYRRRRSKKRKRDSDSASLTYAERQQRRIRKKFGAGGAVLGDDPLTRGELERRGKTTASQSKPRVAQSQRGRELRAQAALARLGQGPSASESSVKREPAHRQAQLPFTKAESSSQSIKEDVSTDETDTESDAGPTPGDYEQICPDSGDTNDKTDDEAENVKAERCEWDDLYSIPLATETEAETKAETEAEMKSKTGKRTVTGAPSSRTDRSETQQEPRPSHELPCPACSLSNPTLNACCVACGCVVRPEKVPGHWRCTQPACRSGTYINAGDYGVCGVCGVRRNDAT